MQDYTLTVTAEDLGIIAAALNELPRKVSQALFVKLQAQVATQETTMLDKGKEEEVVAAQSAQEAGAEAAKEHGRR